MLEEAGHNTASLMAISSACTGQALFPHTPALQPRVSFRNTWVSRKKSLFCCLPALSQLRQKGAKSCKLGWLWAQASHSPSCLLPQCSYNGLLADPRVFLSVYCGFGAHQSQGWLMDEPTLCLPTASLLPSGHVGAGGQTSPWKFSCFDATGYLDQLQIILESYSLSFLLPTFPQARAAYTWCQKWRSVSPSFLLTSDRWQPSLSERY